MSSQDKPKSGNFYDDDMNINTTIDQANRTNEWLRDSYDEHSEKESSDLYGYEDPGDGEDM